MNIILENIATGMVKPVNGLSGFERKKEAAIVLHTENASVEQKESEIPLGVGNVSIIPTGSVFVPRELFMPQRVEPLQMEVTPQNSQDLIPQQVDNMASHYQAQKSTVVVEENTNSENNASTEHDGEVPKIDVTA